MKKETGIGISKFANYINVRGVVNDLVYINVTIDERGKRITTSSCLPVDFENAKEIVKICDEVIKFSDLIINPFTKTEE